MSLMMFVDGLMHLVFWVTKATKALIKFWITETKRLKGFNDMKKGVFKHIFDMGLDWYKVLDTKSGWVSGETLSINILYS